MFMNYVKVTGAARLYGAASGLTAGLCLLTWKPIGDRVTAGKKRSMLLAHEIAPPRMLNGKSPSSVCSERGITFMLGGRGRKIGCEKLISFFPMDAKECLRAVSYTHLRAHETR